MSELTNVFTNIATAIRTKNGSEETYTPSQMATAIENLPDGGISGIVRLTAAEYAALVSKNPTTLYLVTDATYTNVVEARYIGTTQISEYKNDLSDYEFWYENTFIPAGYSKQTSINFTGANANKNWQFEINLAGRGSSSECTLIGFATDSKEIYWDSYGANTLKVYGDLFDTNGDITTAFINKDIIIKKENGVITVTTDGVQTFTSNTITATSNVKLFNYYNDTYPFNGYINYFGFKWLPDSPTPPAPERTTYTLQTDGNYMIEVTEEYESGGTSIQRFDYDDIMTSETGYVTVDDLLITQDGNEEHFIIKPNYIENKAIEYDNITYSGNTVVETLTAYTTSDPIVMYTGTV